MYKFNQKIQIIQNSNIQQSSFISNYILKPQPTNQPPMTTTRNDHMSEFLIKSTSIPNFDFDIKDHYHFKGTEMMWLVHETIEECYLYIQFP